MRIMIAAIAAGVSLIAGCAAPYQQSPQAHMVRLVEDRSELITKRSDLEAKRRRLATTKAEQEINALQVEISELEKRIEALELKIAKAEKEAETARQIRAQTGTAGSHRGPRGGCYTITKSGKKNYGGC